MKDRILLIKIIEDGLGERVRRETLGSKVGASQEGNIVPPPGQGGDDGRHSVHVTGPEREWHRDEDVCCMSRGAPVCSNDDEDDENDKSFRHEHLW